MCSDPAPQSGGPVIVFDGVCVICNGWVRFLLARDGGRHRFAAMQGAHGRGLLRQHGLDPDDPVSFLLVEGERAEGERAEQDRVDGGRAWTDTDAIARVLHSLGGGWRFAAACLQALPGGMRDRVYRLLARNRYRWFGTTVCHVPTPGQRARFLD